jgi:catechol 2,3-dioxygenase-like lactoylglutathione lyase family enzyme
MLDATFFGAVRQIGYAVRDVDRAIAHYCTLDGSSLEFDCFEVVLDASNGYLYRGHPAACRLKIATVTINSMDFEFIEVLDGQHPAGDFIASHGEGINHLALYLDDLEPIRQRIVEHGGRVIIEGDFAVSEERKGRFAYMQSGDSPYPLYELVQM